MNARLFHISTHNHTCTIINCWTVSLANASLPSLSSRFSSSLLNHSSSSLSPYCLQSALRTRMDNSIDLECDNAMKSILGYLIIYAIYTAWLLGLMLVSLKVRSNHCIHRQMYRGFDMPTCHSALCSRLGCHFNMFVGYQPTLTHSSISSSPIIPHLCTPPTPLPTPLPTDPLLLTLLPLSLSYPQSCEKAVREGPACCSISRTIFMVCGAIIFLGLIVFNLAVSYWGTEVRWDNRCCCCCCFPC